MKKILATILVLCAFCSGALAEEVEFIDLWQWKHNEFSWTFVLYDETFLRVEYQDGTSLDVHLRKEGDKYYDINSQFGDYYTIGEDGELYWYDKDRLMLMVPKTSAD